MTVSILVVDDVPAMQEVLTSSLTSEGYRVATAGSGEEALSRIVEQEFDVILTDIVLPGVGGLAVLERSRLLNPRAAVILMTAFASLETAVAALRHGASDYLEKPFCLDELSSRLQRVLGQRETPVREKPRSAREERTEEHQSSEALLGESRRDARVLRDQIAKSARTPSTVLVTGESGTGKELVARASTRPSSRATGPFIAVNCGGHPGGAAREPALRARARRVHAARAANRRPLRGGRRRHALPRRDRRAAAARSRSSSCA